MKKIFFVIALVVLAFSTQAQTITINLDSITGDSIHHRPMVMKNQAPKWAPYESEMPIVEYKLFGGMPCSGNEIIFVTVDTASPTGTWILDTVRDEDVARMEHHPPYIIGQVVPWEENAITLSWQYKGDACVLYLLEDKTGKGNGFTTIASVSATFSTFQFQATMGSAYRIIAGKDSSNIVYYTTRQTLNFSNKFLDSLTLSTKTVIEVSDKPRTDVRVQSWYKMPRFKISTADGVTIIDVNNEVTLKGLVNNLNTAQSFDERLNAIYILNLFAEDCKKAEFSLPQLPAGNYMIEIFSDHICRPDVKYFRIQ